MAQQDLIQKTRFEKQIPFPILNQIAEMIKEFDTHVPPVDIESQFKMLQNLAAGLDGFILVKDAQQDLIALIAEAIITIKMMDEN